MNKAEQILGLILALVIAGIMIGYVFPIAMTAYHSTDTSGWSSEEAAIWGVLGIFFILVILVAITGWAIMSFRRDGY